MFLHVQVHIFTHILYAVMDESKTVHDFVIQNKGLNLSEY